MGDLRVRVKPGSSRRGFLEEKEGVWQVALQSPPHEGKANQELLKLIARVLGCPISRISISSGIRSRSKTVSIRDLSDEEIRSRIHTLRPQEPD